MSFSNNYQVEAKFTLSVLTPGGGNRTDLEACGTTLAAQAATLFGPTNPTSPETSKSCEAPWTVMGNATVTPKDFACSYDRSTKVNTGGKEYCCG